MPGPFLTRRPNKNIQVTHDANPNNDRSESDLVVNPRDARNMVGSSKRFTIPGSYQFSLAAYATFNGGHTWKEATLLPPQGTDFTSDPAVAFDDAGNAYLLGLMWSNGPAPHQINFLGLAAYTSTDGGLTWSAPNVIYAQFADKQVMVGDTTVSSPHHGNIYAAWDGAGGIQFARTQDHGATWTGIKQGGVNQPVGSVIAPGGNFASISVTRNGTLVIFYMVAGAGGEGINMVISADGGDTFTSPTAVTAQVVTGIVSVPGVLPGGQFRLETIPTSCAGSAGNVVVAWPDYRNGVAQVFYRRSDDGGATWHGSPSGDLLTTAAPSGANEHDFMPQLAATTGGEIACCFYEFGPKGGGSPTPLIDVVTLVSIDDGATFNYRLTVTDEPWDPTVDAPTDEFGHSFIGDYFGFAAGSDGFFPFWTDTRTGIQELFTSGVFLVHTKPEVHAETWIDILFGIVNDSGGVGIVGGHIIVVPPRGPERGMLTSILVGELARNIPGAQGREVRAAAYKALSEIATKELQAGE